MIRICSGCERNNAAHALKCMYCGVSIEQVQPVQAPIVSSAAVQDLSEPGVDPFLTARAGPWGARNVIRLLLWPRPDIEVDNRMRMHVADLLRTDPATVGFWLRCGSPMRILGDASIDQLKHAEQALRRLGMWVFFLRPADLRPALDMQIAETASTVHGRILLQDAAGRLMPLHPPVLAVSATLPAGSVQREGSSLALVRETGDFSAFEGELQIVDFYHAGGLVRLRADRFRFNDVDQLPEGLWPRLRALTAGLLPPGSRHDTGFSAVSAMMNVLERGRVLPQVESAVPVREWALTEYGCAAYSGFRTGLLPKTT